MPKPEWAGMRLRLDYAMGRNNPVVRCIRPPNTERLVPRVSEVRTDESQVSNLAWIDQMVAFVSFTVVALVADDPRTLRL